MYLKLPMYVAISHFLSQLAKNPSKWRIPRIFGENLKSGLFSSKIRKFQFFVTQTSLKPHCDVK